MIKEEPIYRIYFNTEQEVKAEEINFMLCHSFGYSFNCNFISRFEQREDNGYVLELNLPLRQHLESIFMEWLSREKGVYYFADRNGHYYEA